MNHIKAIQQAIAASELDAVMITSKSNRLYATGFHSSAGVAIVTADRAWFFTDSRYAEAAKNSISGVSVELVDREETYSKKINQLISDHGIKSLGFEDDDVSYAAYTKWSAKLAVGLTQAHMLLSDLRAVKTREDISSLIVAQRIAEKAFEEILPLISSDITEKELAAELIYRLLKNGADETSFDPIIVSGVRSSLPHGVPTNACISKGFLTIDFGARKNGWCSDTTRTLCVGAPDDEMKYIYETVLKAQMAGIDAVKAGVKGCDIDGAARRVIDDAGYGQYFGHGFGHGVGLDVHEAPNASSANLLEIPEGAVISAEPGIYIPGRYGVRIEDVVYVRQSGCENITNLSKELLIV